MTLTVVGCGNECAGDDAVGLLLVSHLSKIAPDCDFHTTTNPIDLLEMLDVDGPALIVDGVVGGAEPGTVYLMRLERFASDPLRCVSGHSLDVPSVCRLGAALGRHLPHIMLLGIEVGSVEPGTLLTPHVMDAVAYCMDHFDSLRRHVECGEEVTIPGSAIARVTA